MHCHSSHSFCSLSLPSFPFFFAVFLHSLFPLLTPPLPILFSPSLPCHPSFPPPAMIFFFYPLFPVISPPSLPSPVFQSCSPSPLLPSLHLPLLCGSSFYPPISPFQHLSPFLCLPPPSCSVLSLPCSCAIFPRSLHLSLFSARH